MPVDVSVQICSYNRLSHVSVCLAALVRQSWPATRFEVVLVDDGSDEPLSAHLDAARHPFPLRVLRVPHGGLARARNAGIRGASGEVVLFIDDDTVADERLVEEHWKSHARHPHAVVSGWVNHVDPARPTTRRRPRLADLSTSFFWTSNVSVRRGDLIAAGLFDEAFTEYGWEDVEFGERLRDRGLKRRYNRRAIVSHVKRPWRGTDIEALLRQAEASGRSAALFVAKRPTFRARLATGASPLRMALNRLLEPGGGWYRHRTERAGEAVLLGLDKLAAYLATRVAYFRAMREAVETGGGGAGKPAGDGLRNIVVLRTDKIGDLLVSTPAIRSIRSALPDARITLLVSPRCADVLRGWDAVDGVEVFDAGDTVMRRRMVRRMRAARPDAVFALTPRPAIYMLARRIGAPVRVGFGYRARPLDAVAARLALTHPVLSAVPESPGRASEVPHHADELLALVTAAGLPATRRPLEVPVAEQDRAWARSALAAAGICGPPVAVHLSNKWLDEGWETRDVLALLDGLSELDPQHGMAISVGPSDQEMEQATRPHLAGHERVAVFQNLTFGRWAALVAASAVVVSPDTGAIHLASATGRPVVGVYAASRFHVLSRQWAPWMVPNRVVKKARGVEGVQAIVEAVQSLIAETVAS